MRVLISGGNGFIGSHLSKKLLEMGDEVTVLTRTIPEKLLEGIKYIKCDFSISNDFKQFLPKEIDTIFHLAQSTNQPNLYAQIFHDFNVNLNSTVDLLEYARQSKAKKFFFFSSGAIYRPTTELKLENTARTDLEGIDSYTLSKLTSEWYVNQYVNAFQVVTIRPFFPYGKGQSRARLIPRLIDCVKNNQEISLNSHNGLTTNPIYIDDLIESLIKLLEYDKSITLDLCGSETFSLREIISIIGHALQKEPLIKCSNNSDLFLCGNPNPSLTITNYHPQIIFAEGIKNCLR